MAVSKGLLIFPIFKDLNSSDGVIVKNEGIRKGFQKNGVDIDVLEFNTRGVFNRGKQVYTFAPGRYRRTWQYWFGAWSSILDNVGADQYEFVWFRLSLNLIFTGTVARFLKKLKQRYPNVKVVLEYGAYPFDAELTKQQALVYRLRKGQLPAMHRSTDFVITYSGQERVDHLENIPINNGIELDTIPVNPPGATLKDGVRFISVSSLKKWHAYERFIEGMPAYLARPDAVPIHFDVVGNGPEYDKLASLVAALKLEKHVSFLGHQNGAGLDAIYERNHVAIGTLGFHRIGISNSSSLKNREYFARGLPIVLSTKDLDMPATCPYVQYVPEGEAPLDIASVVAFAQQVYQTPDLARTIRAYAENTISWTSKIRTVLEYLNR